MSLNVTALIPGFNFASANNVKAASPVKFCSEWQKLTPGSVYTLTPHCNNRKGNDGGNTWEVYFSRFSRKGDISLSDFVGTNRVRLSTNGHSHDHVFRNVVYRPEV